MAYPTTLDDNTTLPVESASTPLSTNHVTNHTAMRTAIIAIETLLGITASAISGTVNYILGEITGTDKAVGKTATQTLANKTLTSPKITVGSDAVGDIHYTSNVDGTQSRLAKGNDNQILKMNGTSLNWEDETVTVNGSTTVAGIFEAATAAEVTAGTATGGTGAVLAVTPDSLAGSTPVFNGSGLTNIMKAKNGTLTISSSTTTTITTSFRPYHIELHAVNGGGAGGAVPATSRGGYDATSNTMWCTFTTHNTNGSVNGSGSSSAKSLDITYGSNPTATTAVINNITATSFDIVSTIGSANVDVYWTATGY